MADQPEESLIENGKSEFLTIPNFYMVRVTRVDDFGRLLDPIAEKVLNNTSFPFKVQFDIARIIDKISIESKFFNGQAMKIVKEFADVGDDGNPVMDNGSPVVTTGETDGDDNPIIDIERLNKMNQQYAELMQLKIEVPVRPLVIGPDDHAHMPNLSGDEFKVLRPIMATD